MIGDLEQSIFANGMGKTSSPHYRRLDQCDRIAIRFACKGKKAYSQRPRSVIVSEETKAESPFRMSI